MARTERISFTPASQEGDSSKFCINILSEDLVLFYALLKKWKPSGDVGAIHKRILQKELSEILSEDPLFIP